jgi:hypothetical protein
MVFDFHGFHHKSTIFQFIQFHLNGGGPLDKDGSFHSMQQIDNW